MFGRMLDKRGQSPNGLLRCKQLPQSCQPFELRGKPLRSHAWADAGQEGTVPRRIAALQAAPAILPTIRTPRKTAAFSCLGGCWTRGDSPPTDCCAASSSHNPANHSNSAENRCVLMFGRVERCRILFCASTRGLTLFYPGDLCNNI